MRLALTICSILIGSFIASAQPNSKLTLETELFSIEFPDLPEFDHDTLDSKDTLISYSHTVDHDSITYLLSIEIAPRLTTKQKLSMLKSIG